MCFSSIVKPGLHLLSLVFNYCLTLKFHCKAAWRSLSALACLHIFISFIISSFSAFAELQHIFTI